MGNIFDKLEPNAFQYEKDQREELLNRLDQGNQISTEDYTFISQTYASHINELLPSIEKEQNGNWIIPFTFIYVISGIGLRCLLNADEQSVLLVMGVINILALGLALFVLCGNINKRVTNWISQALILDEDKKTLLAQYAPKRNWIFVIAGIIEGLILVIEIILYNKGVLAIGNDAVSIIAFGIAFFSENVETCLVQKIEKELTEVKL